MTKRNIEYMDRNESEEFFKIVKRTGANHWKRIDKIVRTGSNQYQDLARNVSGYETNKHNKRIFIGSEFESIKGRGLVSNSSTGFFMSEIENGETERRGYYEELPMLYFNIQEKLRGQKHGKQRI